MLPLFVRALAWLVLTPCFLLALPHAWLLAPSDGVILSDRNEPVVVPQLFVTNPPGREIVAWNQAPAALSQLLVATRVITVVIGAPAVSAEVAWQLLASTAATLTRSAETTTESADQPSPTSVVNTDLLNLRTGPGQEYSASTVLDFGAALEIDGRSADCRWLQVRTATGESGWVVAEYVTLFLACEQLPIVVAPAPPAAPLPAEIIVAQAPIPAAADLPSPAPAPLATCGATTNEAYDLITIEGAPTARPAAQHPDINLAVRGYEPTGAELAVIEFDAADDPAAPQLRGLFADRRIPALHAAYQVYDWDWGCDCRGAALALRGASLAGVAVAPGEWIYTPDSGRSIGSGYEVLVLYADERQLTLKYTREDSAVHGYTLHLADLCVEPRLLALYHEANGAGRGRLPALRPGQAVGQAAGAELKVVIRDTGDFMDPRDREEWWRVP